MHGKRTLRPRVKKLIFWPTEAGFTGKIYGECFHLTVNHPEELLDVANERWPNSTFELELHEKEPE